MIVRIWRGQEDKAHPGAYRRHLEGAVYPQLGALAGFQGASLLQREIDGGTEVVVMTSWENMQAVEAFAGSDPGKAVVEPGAQAVLSRFDDTVSHYEVVSRLPAPSASAAR